MARSATGRAWRLGRAPRRILDGMSAPRVVAVAPGSAAARAGLQVGDEVRQPQRPGAARRHPVAAAGRRRRPRRSRSAGAGSSSPSRSPSATGEPLGAEVARRCSTRCAPATTTASSASSTSCRRACGTSLYLKDDDYRLSFLYGNFTTLTRFTEADLERVAHRGPVAAQRQHPRHRPRRAGRHAAQPAGRHQPALAAGAARPRHRGARPGRGVPRRQRRRRARRHARRRARPVPRAGVAVRSCRSACRRYNTEPDMRPHTRAEAEAVVDAVADWQERLPATCSAAAWCSPPTSTTCWPAGRSRPPSDYEGFPMHEDGIGMARTFELELLGPGRRADRRRRAGSSPGSTARRPRATGRRATRPATPALACASRHMLLDAAHAGDRDAGGHPHRRVRGPGARAAAGRGSVAPTCGSPRAQRVLRRQHRR